MNLAARLLTWLPFFPVWPAYADLDGIVVPLRDSPFPPWLRRHLLAGGYESKERELVKELVRTGDQVLELGASAGIVTSFLWRQVGPTGRVVSVEAERSLEAPFREQLSCNGFHGEWCLALCFPTWDPAVPESFKSRRFLRGKHNLVGAVAPAQTGEFISKSAGPVQPQPQSPDAVPWRTAAEICNETELCPTIVVADIEGSEEAWLDHPARFPQSVKRLIIEFHPDVMGPQAAGRCVQAVIDEGYRIAVLSGNVIGFERTASSPLPERTNLLARL